MSCAAVGGMALRRAAMASTCPRSTSSSTTALTRPMRRASSASMRSPSRSSSRALAGPTARVSTHALPWSPELPTRRNALTNTAERAAYRRSHAHANDKPAPAQGPLTAAMVSAGIPWRSSETSMIPRRSTGSALPVPSPVIAVTSPPALNPRPAPVRMTNARRCILRERVQGVAQCDDVLEVEHVQTLGPVQGDGDDPAVTIDADAQDRAAFAASTSTKICSGPSGVLVAFTPRGRSASATALATAAWAPMAPPSPMPL